MLRKKMTICVTTFNRWDSCIKTLYSVCSQTLQNVEIILVDDCSSDEMPQDVERFIRENRVIYARHRDNMGLAMARNTAIKLATGTFFAFCDDDDIWPSGMAARLLAAFCKGGDGIGVSIAFSPTLRPDGQAFFEKPPKLTELFLRGITPPVSAQLYDTNMIRNVGGYSGNIKSGVDHDLWISLAKLNPRVAVDWGGAAIVGRNPHAVRMTTVEVKRREKISNSLGIWRPKLVKVFGELFYHHFCYSYERHLNFSFFVQSLRKREYGQALRKLLWPYVFKTCIEAFYSKSTGRKPINVFPAYRRGKDENGASCLYS